MPAEPTSDTTDAGGDLALVLTGGGARGAYQAGFLRSLARQLPTLQIPIITGISAGAINAVYLAAGRGSFEESTHHLEKIWTGLQISDVFRVDLRSIARSLARWGARIAAGGMVRPRVTALLDNQPLAFLLKRTLGTVDGEITGIARNLEAGRLKAVALTTVNYSTGQSVTWVQGGTARDTEEPDRRTIQARLTVDHVMASVALPLFFPAVRLGRQWYGDGGIRLFAPLSPAIRLGAGRILAVSTRYQRSLGEASRPTIEGYPPPAQILGQLLNTVFLDVLDQDVERAGLVNRMLAERSPAERPAMRPVKVLIQRPSRDLGRLAGEYESKLPAAFRFLARGLGTRETRSPDMLSFLMFQRDYVRRLLEIGEEDAERRCGELMALLDSLR